MYLNLALVTAAIAALVSAAPITQPSQPWTIQCEDTNGVPAPCSAAKLQGNVIESPLDFKPKRTTTTPTSYGTGNRPMLRQKLPTKKPTTGYKYPKPKSKSSMYNNVVPSYGQQNAYYGGASGNASGGSSSGRMYGTKPVAPRPLKKAWPAWTVTPL
ncbi:MAG: hypothetical protein M1826_005728 [Phylliscum demangeonii]|nr:MAG: hypothetical protein M1826_005728 [Phylliscum demangeonii]